MKLHRAHLTVAAIVVAAIVIPGAVATAGQIAPTAKAAPGDLLWDGAASRGTSVFEALEKSPGSVTVADDPQKKYGASFRFETWDNGGTKSRCESRGIATPQGKLRLDSSRLNTTYYVGWRALLDPMPTNGHWISFWQLHWSGAGPGGGPLTVRTLGDGKIYFQYVSPNGGKDGNIWSAPLVKGQWINFVVAVRLAKDNSGYLELWYNGVQQTMINGSTRYTGPIFKGTHVNPKWGVYRSGPNKGHAVQYVNSPKIGLTYESVKP
jgi:hypothetical protein